MVGVDEKKLYKFIRDLLPKSTIVVITHSLKAVESFDYLLKLDQGKLTSMDKKWS